MATLPVDSETRPKRKGIGVVAALLFGLLKLGKLGGSVITMLLSIAFYSIAFGWRYAAGFVGLLAIHETGHYLAAKQRGLPVSAPTFIPFVGAWIQLKDEPMDVETEAYVASAGPLLGTAAALAVYLLARHEHSALLLALSYAGFMLNFFNLIPLHPLDGGRMTAIISPKVWFVGAPMMLAIMLWRPSGLLVLIAILSVPSLIKAWKHDPSDPETARYYRTSTRLRVFYGAFYLGLAAFLALMTTQVSHQLHALAAAHAF